MRKQSLFDTRIFPLRHWAVLGLMLMLAHLGFAHAAGLGRLNVQSQMGQPLSADIELLNVSKDELATLQASLAPTAAYEAANLRFDPALNTLRVAVAQRPNGTPYLRVSTWRPVVEPYIDLVIDLNWHGGRFRRAYSALLEPPVLADAAPAAQALVAAAPAPAPQAQAPAARPASPPATRAAPVARPAAPPAVVAPGPTPAAPPRVAPAPPATPTAAAKAIEPAAKPDAAKLKPEPELKPEPKPADAAKTETPPAPAAKEAAPAPESTPSAAPSPAAAAKPAAAPTLANTPPQRSWIDSVKDNLLPIISGLLALLAGLGVFWMSRRRGQPSAPAHEPVAPVLRQETRKPDAAPKAAAPATPIAPVATATAATATAASPSANAPTVANVTDMVDPLEEAQVYLDHGQDEQAETILREALAKQPGREDVHLKLLEILAARGDKVAFNRLAGGLHKLTYGRGELWQRAAVLGYALDPANPLYPPTNKVVESPAPRETAAALDVDLDRASTGPDAMSNTTSLLLERANDKPMDMEKTMVLTRDALQPAKPETPAPAQPPLEFNFELPAASAPPAEAPPPKLNKADNVIDFKVDLPDINLNLDDKPAPRFPKQVRDEAWEAVQQKLDLARAYQEMGDKEGALETLGEVGNGGDEAQQAQARKMMEELRSAQP